MTVADLPQVEALDRDSFPTPWPAETFEYEVTRNPCAFCWVAEKHHPDTPAMIVGFIVIWLVVDEAHIATFAIQQDFRRKGIAQALLAATLLLCHQQGGRMAMLEVREGNLGAQMLYQKFGFEVVGSRKNYYQDSHEAAILMTLAPLNPEKLVALSLLKDDETPLDR